ncbi:MAG TPA: hypothetical protein VIC26_06100 [Marinagarivorans sp.]
MSFASLLQWLPTTISPDTTAAKNPITAQQWRILADAKHKRLPLILYSTSEYRGQGFQSLVLKIDQRSQLCFIDMPLPALPSDHLSLPRRIYATLKYPGTYQHWQIEARIIERAHAGDGPYFKMSVEAMTFCRDRRRQARFSFVEKNAEVSCTPAMEPPIYGSLDNISLGGICFNARGNLQQSDAFYRASQGHKRSIPISVQLNNDDELSVDIEVLSLQVLKKPYLHTRVRARFVQLNLNQQHVLAALTDKLAEVA